MQNSFPNSIKNESELYSLWLEAISKQEKEIVKPK